MNIKFDLQNAGYYYASRYPENGIKISVGCDPEFEPWLIANVLDNDNNIICPAVNRISASDFSRIYSPNNEIKNILHTRVGLDRCRRCVELRPKPSNNVDDVIKNIASLVKRIHKRGMLLSVWSLEEPIGGHIHIGSLDKNNPLIGDLIYPFNNLVKLLDRFIGKPTQVLNPNNRDGTQSNRYGYTYGNLSDARNKEHGFEYRTPPAAIFLTPNILRMCLQIAQNLATKYFNFETISIGEEKNINLSEYDQLNIDGQLFHNIIREISQTESKIISPAKWLKERNP